MRFGFGFGFGSFGGAVDVLARPGGFTFSASAGTEDGEVDLTISDVASIDWGDLSEPGDGLGTAGILEVWNEGDGWALLADPAADDTYGFTFNIAYYGTIQTIGVRAVSDEGITGPAQYREVSVPGVIPDEEYVTVDGETVTYNGEPVFVNPTAPDQFGLLDWDVVPVAPGEVDLVINALPFTGNVLLDDIVYRVDGGAQQSTGLIAPGTVSITGLGTSEVDFEIAGVNRVGQGPWSTAQPVTAA